ncbi:MAG: OmpH/Skp family outer membrane protein [Thiobacillus sp.]
MWVKQTVRIALATLLLASGMVTADTKIGFVNTEKLLREAPLSVAAQKRLEKEFSGREQELQKMTKQAREVQSQLDKEGVTMSETERKNKERELANLNREFQKQSREFREDLNLRRNEELSQIQERARKVIVDIAKTEKYDIIIEQAAVYVDPKSDITDRVMKALGGK